MSSYFKRLAFAGCLAFAAWVAPAAAQTMVPAQDPIASFQTPAGWAMGRTSRGVELRSPDAEVFVWFEAYAPAEHERVVREHDVYFRKQGVAFTGAAHANEMTLGAVTIKTMTHPARWNGAPTVLRYVVYTRTDPTKRILLMTYWASPEGDARHDAATQALVLSIKPLG